MDVTCVCSICQTTFKQKKSLYRHLRNIHNVEPLDKREVEFECEKCEKKFSSKSSLNQHVKKFHGPLLLPDHKYVEEPTRKTRVICCFQECDIEFATQRQYRVHLLEDHDLNIEMEELCFQSVQEFEHWKKDIESQSFAFYTLDTGGKTLANGHKKLYYNCHRSLKYNSKGENKRAIKSMGSNKINKACPARLEVEVINSKVIVKFYKTHSGHETQIGRIMLDKKIRAQIADKLKDGVTFEHILDSVRDSHLDNGTLERISLLERKDLHNIVRDFNINYTTKRHQEDAISIQIWVREMEDLGEECPVLFYKGQNEEDTVLEKEDFALMLMTKYQAQLLTKFGNDKICIDGTHGTNAYDIQLYTLMTVDEFQSGCPVAFCFSNRGDEQIFQLFFEKIKSKIGLITADVFMSDDYPAFYNAWHSVMTEVPHRLLCTWHIDRNWRNNLNKIKGGPEKQGLVYKTLRFLLELTSIEEFKTSSKQVLENLLTDQDTKVFGQYFEKYYFSRPECWAYCYRIGLGINTNMYLESYHKILKHIYLQGKQVKRLDKSIDAVMKLARDSYFSRLIKLAKNHSASKVQNVHKSHRASQNIKSEYVETIEVQKSWMVPSTKNCIQKYCVIWVQQSCLNPCLKCSYCNICIHTFKCSCTDNVIKMNICKHIHFCAEKFFTGTESQTQTTIDTNYANEITELSDVRPPSCNKTNNKNNKELINKKLEFLVELFKTVTLDDEDTNLIEKKLDQIIDTLNKKKQRNLREVVNINVQKNVAKQARVLSTKRNIKKISQKSSSPNKISLYSTKKRTVKINNFKKPSTLEQAAIKTGLNNPDGETINVNSSFDHLYTCT